jgi:N-acetylmuramic acid 6-phosphate etherase
MYNYRAVTESPSHYHDLEHKSIRELLQGINAEDHLVPQAVAVAIPSIEKLVEALFEKMETGGRLFYIGAGTSGRLGVVDASECPPTYGVDPGRVVGIIAGGREAMFRPIENAEDDTEQAWRDLQAFDINPGDFVVGISASGTTPYVLGGLTDCKANSIATGCICNNDNTVIGSVADYPVEVVAGPEFVTGSTRMKSGTAQKLVLNMISTSVMIKLGFVQDNKMVNMQLTNQKLLERGTLMVMQATGITEHDEARQLLVQQGSVRKAVEQWQKTGQEKGSN